MSETNAAGPAELAPKPAQGLAFDRHGYAAWRARDEALRLSVPPAPAEPRAGDVVQTWRFSGDGWAHVAHLLVPRDIKRNRPRSDHYTLMIDDKQVAERVTVAAALKMVAGYLPSQPTREQRAEAVSWANVRPDLDAAAAQMEA